MLKYGIVFPFCLPLTQKTFIPEMAGGGASVWVKAALVSTVESIRRHFLVVQSHRQTVVGGFMCRGSPADLIYLLEKGESQMLHMPAP